MIACPRFVLFLSAALLLALTPGPGILYVLGRTLNGGRWEGVLSALGTFIGGSVHILAAAFGLSAVLATSATAFEVVRYAGAAYLIYLGIGMIRNRNQPADLPLHTSTSRAHFTQGIITEVLNPKTALFFLSFIPQFVSVHHGHVVLQFLLLGTISVTLNTGVDLAVVLCAGALTHRLRHNRVFYHRQRTASGAGMIGLGLYLGAT